MHQIRIRNEEASTEGAGNVISVVSKLISPVDGGADL
jgi:hypothetical protein